MGILHPKFEISTLKKRRVSTVSEFVHPSEIVVPVDSHTKKLTELKRFSSPSYRISFAATEALKKRFPGFPKAVFKILTFSPILHSLTKCEHIETSPGILESLRGKRVIFACSHRGVIEHALLQHIISPVFEHLHYIAKKNMFDHPFSNIFASQGNAFPLDRSDRRQSYGAVKLAANELVTHRVPTVIHAHGSYQSKSKPEESIESYDNFVTPILPGVTAIPQYAFAELKQQVDAGVMDESELNEPIYLVPVGIGIGQTMSSRVLTKLAELVYDISRTVAPNSKSRIHNTIQKYRLDSTKILFGDPIAVTPEILKNQVMVTKQLEYELTKVLCAAEIYAEGRYSRAASQWQLDNEIIEQPPLYSVPLPKGFALKPNPILEQLVIPPTQKLTK
jgi:Acyltransferase